jgi:hypothetical protein
MKEKNELYTIDLFDRCVIEMETGEILMYIEDKDLYVGINNDAYLEDVYLVRENIKHIYRDYTMSDVIL